MGAGAGRLVAAAPRRGGLAAAARAGRVAARQRYRRRPRPDAGDHDRVAAGALHWCFAGDWEWTFGERRRPLAELVDFSPSAAVALERFWATLDRWRDSVAAMTDEQLDTVGFGQNPNSDAAELPFITVIAAANIELIHHMAEVALLQDLYRTRSTGSRGRAVGQGAPTHGPSAAQLVRRAADGRLLLLAPRRPGGGRRRPA